MTALLLLLSTQLLVSDAALFHFLPEWQRAAAAGRSLFDDDFDAGQIIPESRRGRATAEPVSVIEVLDSDDDDVSVNDEDAVFGRGFATPRLSISENGGDAAALIKSLIESRMGDPVNANDDDDEEEEATAPIAAVGDLRPDRAVDKASADNLSKFGQKMAESLRQNAVGSILPQLAFRQPSPPQMTLLDQNQRQAAAGAAGAAGSGSNADSDVRCVPKVMQVEETVYDEAVQCTHSYIEKCHLTYITDYVSSNEQKCETTFKKNCHITFKPMPFNETVSVCNTPVVRQCGNESQGPDICSTQYETTCETTYKTYTIEQDEPVCTMEIVKKCTKVTLPSLRDDDGGSGDGSENDSEDATSAPPSDLVTVSPGEEPELDPTNVTIDRECEEWPVQKCTLQKQEVKKVHPDTSCRNIPRQVCVPNNCAMVPGPEVCHDEMRTQVQNVPQEECELQPEETCHMEAVLVPKLVPKPNCIKVPKEICVNTKKNPHRVKKPVIQEWCYRPQDLLNNPGDFEEVLAAIAMATSTTTTEAAPEDAPEAVTTTTEAVTTTTEAATTTTTTTPDQSSSTTTAPTVPRSKA